MNLTKIEKLIIEDFVSDLKVSDIEKNSIQNFLNEKQLDSYFNDARISYIVELFKKDETILETIQSSMPKDGAPGSNGINGLDGINGKQGTDGVVGPKGSNGTSVLWQGDWVNSKSYKVGDIVRYFKILYICKMDCSEELPTNKILWDVFINIPSINDSEQKSSRGSGTGVKEVVKIAREEFINTNVDKIITGTLELDSVVSGQTSKTISLVIIDNNGNVITEE